MTMPSDHYKKMIRPLPLKDHQQHQNNAVVTKIKSLLAEKAITPLLIVVVGSRAKGMASKGSDYDTYVIGLSTYGEYLLQKANRTFHFQTELADGLELEGTVYDYITIKNYILSNNMVAYDVFAGMTIYSTPMAEELRRVYIQLYEPARLAKSLNGMLMGDYEKKKLHKLGTGKTTRKVAAEALYIALKLLYIETFPGGGPPPYRIMDILKRLEVSILADDINKWIVPLLDSRIVDKLAEYVATDDFSKLIYEALDVIKLVGSTVEKKQQGEQLVESNKRKLEDLFLNLFL